MEIRIISGNSILLLATIAAISALPRPEVEILTQPKPGDEYVFVQSSASGARPVTRKEKLKEKLDHPFETAHKLPPSLTYALNNEEVEEKTEKVHKLHKRESPADEAPAPAGAIKLDIQKLLEKYKTDLKTSTTPPKNGRNTTTTTKSGKRRTPSKRAKRNQEEIIVTSPSPVLTTAPAAPKKAEIDDIPLVASGSEKQRSRIQIKKGPNGQEYEYEYVYYYYDDDDDAKDTDKVADKVSDKVYNSHDGPARNQVTQAPKTRHSTSSAAPEVNEVVPSSSRSRSRGRQLGEDDGINEERLPANTRFPPRSRNLNTTPLPDEETKLTRGRGRGRPTSEAAPTVEVDNVSDETQGSQGRTRANVRRPSLDLVDSASFNTNPNPLGAEPAQSSPSFPTDLPAGPVRFLGATPNESVDPPEQKKKETESLASDLQGKDDDDVTIVPETETTTVMSPMDKVALDLYAILQGTQKLSGEDGEISPEDGSTDSTNDVEVTTLEVTTLVETTTPAITTTTTTTTAAPTTTTTATTTTTEAPAGRGRFKGRGRKTTQAAVSSATTETAPAESKPKGKYGRPSFGGRSRSGARTTPEPAVEKESSKEEAKPVSHSRPTLSRNRFGASRPRARTTPSPESHEESESSSTSAPAARPSLTRPRSSFNLRSRVRTTASPSIDGESSSDESASTPETTQTTARTRKIQAGSAVRPLRPGPRLNLARGRPSQPTTTTEAPVENHITGDEEVSSSTEESAEKAVDTSTAPVDNSPLGRLRNKHRPNLQVRPKAAASAPVQVRRINPLLSRRKSGQSTEASSTEAPAEASPESSAAEETGDSTEEPIVASSSTTTEEPRGLNKLLAGRRRLVRPPTTHQ